MAGFDGVHRVHLVGLVRDLPLLEVAPGVRIAVLNILGDTELAEAAGAELGGRIAELGPDVLVTAEAKSIAVTHAVATRLANLPYVVLRKAYKAYMGEALRVETLSITTGAPQSLFLDDKDRRLLAGARAVIVDDVVSTGSTLRAMRELVGLAGATVVGEAAIFTEGEPGAWDDVIALGHLPLFR